MDLKFPLVQQVRTWRSSDQLQCGKSMCVGVSSFWRSLKSHCDWSDHSPLCVHLYHSTCSPLHIHHLKLKSKSFIYCINLSVPHRLSWFCLFPVIILLYRDHFSSKLPTHCMWGRLNISIVFTPHFKLLWWLWAPVLQSLAPRFPVLLVLTLPSRSLFTQHMESSLAPTPTLPHPFRWLNPFHSSSPHNCHAVLIIVTHFCWWSQHHLGLMTHCLGTYIWNLAKLLDRKSVV